MRDAARYHGPLGLSKVNLRKALVREVFGSSAEAARQFGRDRSTVNQIVSLTRTSAPLNKLIYREILRRRGRKIADLWAA